MGHFFDNLNTLARERGQVSLASLKQAYEQRFGSAIQTNGGKLKPLLDKAERSGAVRLADRGDGTGLYMLPGNTHRSKETRALPLARMSAGHNAGIKQPHTEGSPSMRLQHSDGRGNTVDLSLQAVRRRLCFIGCVDASGSMRGSRAASATRGMKHVVDMMHTTDLYGLFTFDTSVCNLHHAMESKRVDWSKDAEHIISNANSGGRTALYDGIAEGIKECKSTLERHGSGRHTSSIPAFWHIVITDGADNASKQHSLESIVQLVAKPGLPDYHLVLIAVEMSPQATRSMRQICTSRHATFANVGSVRELENTLQRYAEQIQIELRVGNGGRQRTRTIAHTSRAGVASALRSMDDATSGALSGVTRMFSKASIER